MPNIKRKTGPSFLTMTYTTHHFLIQEDDMLQSGKKSMLQLSEHVHSPFGDYYDFSLWSTCRLQPFIKSAFH